MKMLVLGAGRMGLGAVHDLAAQKDVSEVTVADVDALRARDVAVACRAARSGPFISMSKTSPRSSD